MKLERLLEGLEYRIIQGDLSLEIEDVVYDSRKANLKNAFIALKGSQIDSHQFIPQVIEKGCPVVIVEDVPEVKNGTIIQVKDSRVALELLATNLFGRPQDKLTLIGITGTKGKTTVTNMLASILRKSGKKVGTIGTLGADFGDRIEVTNNTTPESYELQKIFSRMVSEGITHIIMEVSSQAIKMRRIENLTFDYILFTNLSPDHIGPDEHKDFEEYKGCKHQIFLKGKVGIYNKDDEHAADIIKDFEGEKLFAYSIKESSDYQGYHYELKRAEGFLGIDFKVRGQLEYDFSLNMPGKFSVYNGLAAISVADLLGVPLEDMKTSLKEFKVNGRAELIPGPKDFVCLVDYAHNKVSLLNILETLREFEYNRLVCVFGCGGNRPAMRRFEMGEAASRYCDHIIVTMDNPRFESVESITEDILVGVNEHKTSYEVIHDRKAAIYHALTNGEPGDIILIAGKGHEDYIDMQGVKTHFSDQETVRSFFEEK